MPRESTPAEDPTANVRLLRAASAERVRETTLRYAAREIGITPTSLKNFITMESLIPYGRTMERLRAWYRRDLLRRRSELSEEEAAAVLEMLLAQLPSAERGRAAADVLERLARLHERLGTPMPPWLDPLLRAYRAGRTPGDPDAPFPPEEGEWT